MDIVPLRQEQLQERLGQRYYELDAPLRVDWADGRRDAVLFRARGRPLALPG